jgi:LmbE family N-acetylglucosaminyl deacetylase
MRNVLVVAAHPHDEVLGCGGTIIKNIKMGNRVSVLTLTDGALGRYDKKTTQRLRKGFLDSAKVLGLSKVFVANLPNQSLDTVPISRVIREIEGIVGAVKPEILYTHHGGDLNRDHRVVHEATLVATRPLPGSRIEKVLAYFVPSSTEYNDTTDGSHFKAKVFEDITREIDQKIKAFACYKTEERAFPHPRSREGLRTYAQMWGIGVGVPYAEPFCLIRGIERSS